MNKEEFNKELGLLQEGLLPWPVHSKVLIRVEGPVEKISDGGIVYGLDDDNPNARCYGHILAMGPYVGYRRGVPNKVINYKPGDRVIYYKYAGSKLEEKFGNQAYRVIEDLDMECTYGNKLLEETK